MLFFLTYMMPHLHTSYPKSDQSICSVVGTRGTSGRDLAGLQTSELVLVLGDA